MRVLGIDPGTGGALALITADGAELHDMPTLTVGKGREIIDVRAAMDLLDALSPSAIYMEQVGGRPGQSAPAAFSFGRAVGVIEAAAKLRHARFCQVGPNAWKRSFKLTGLPKAAGRAVAVDLFPSLARELTKRRIDFSDALLIAAHGTSLEKQGIFA